MPAHLENSEGSAPSGFPFAVRTPFRNIFFDRPAVEHFVRRHMLRDDLINGQCRPQFEITLGLENVSQAVAFVGIPRRGSLVPAARRLAELVVTDADYWVRYRRELDNGKTIDWRVMLFLENGLIVIFQAVGNEWHLRSAYFVTERDRVILNRQAAVGYQIRNHFGQPIQINGQSAREFDPSYRYRTRQSDGSYATHVGFELSRPEAFGLQAAGANGRRLFAINRIQM